MKIPYSRFGEKIKYTCINQNDKSYNLKCLQKLSLLKLFSVTLGLLWAWLIEGSLMCSVLCHMASE